MMKSKWIKKVCLNLDQELEQKLSNILELNTTSNQSRVLRAALAIGLAQLEKEMN